MTEISLYVDTSQLQRAFENIQGSQAVVDEFIGEAQALVKHRMIQNMPKSTWFMAHSVTTRYFKDGFEVLPTAFYTYFVERGTGLFGPRKHLIYPKKAKALRWVSFGKVHFAAYIMGQPGQFFIKKTDEEISGEVFSLSERLWVEHHQVVTTHKVMRKGREVTIRRGPGGRFV